MFDVDNRTVTAEVPQVILAALETEEGYHFEHRIEEMTSLIEACDMEVIVIVTQRLAHPEPGTYFGKGKAMELAETARNTEARYVIFENNLSPVQLKNLHQIIGTEIWDRTTLILEIFSRRARSREAKLQVESAYLQYMLPRLSGMWQHLGRQGGGGGSRANKGVGETQLELDRRQISKRIASLARELEQISHTRQVQRQGRAKGALPRVALVGYTNAGKSTIMNRLLAQSGAEQDKQVLEKDMLFATLDTSVRYIKTEEHRDFLLSDTVGFIENLPHGLIKAFRSTLEEAAHADLIAVVLDASDEFREEHRAVTEKTLKELSADTIPRIYVMNKGDLLPEMADRIPLVKEEEIWISAGTGAGLPQLIEMIIGILYKNNHTWALELPFARGDLLNVLHKKAHILSEEYVPEGIRMVADCPESLRKDVEAYIVS